MLRMRESLEGVRRVLEAVEIVHYMLWVREVMSCVLRW